MSSARLKSLANRQFEAKRHHSARWMQERPANSTTGESDGVAAESKADQEGNGMGDHTTINVERQTSSPVAVVSPAVAPPLCELVVQNADDEVAHISLTNSDFPTLGAGDTSKQPSVNTNKNSSKVYVAPIEDDEVHEA